MKNKKWKKILLIFLPFFLLMVGCGKEQRSTVEEANNNLEISEHYPENDQLRDSEKFYDFSESMFLDEIVKNTIDLHFTIAYPKDFGIQDYEVTLGTYDKDEINENHKELVELSNTLALFSREELTKEQQITYDILADYVELELASEDLYYYGEIFSPLTGIHTQLPVLLSEYTFRCEKDVEDYLILLSQIDETYDSYFIYEKEKAKQGLGVADFSLDDTIEACEAFVENPEKCYLIETFDRRIDELSTLSEDQKDSYKKQNKELVLQDVMEAYETLADNLETLKGKGLNDKGLCHFDKGKEYYEYLVRSNVGSDMEIKQIKETAEEFVENRMKAIYSMIQKDPELYEMLMEEVPLSDMNPEQIMGDLIKKSAKDFGDIPQVPYEIKYVPKEMEEHLNPAFYLTPPIDDPNDNVIYINPKYSERENLYPLLAHEGIPGHLYQIVSSGTYERPLVRNLFSFPGYTEGFATYAELYSYTLVDAKTSYAKLLQYDQSVTLAVSAYLDICVNYYGWDEKDVLKYLKKVGMGDEETAESVFRMVVEEPSEYLEYYVGFLEFMNLRNRAKDCLGDKFDLKAFHEFVIRIGPAPFYLIEDYMEEFIKEQKEVN